MPGGWLDARVSGATDSSAMGGALLGRPDRALRGFERQLDGSVLPPTGPPAADRPQWTMVRPAALPASRAPPTPVRQGPRRTYADRRTSEPTNRRPSEPTNRRTSEPTNRRTHEPANPRPDRKSTRLNSSHSQISYA